MSVGDSSGGTSTNTNNNPEPNTSGSGNVYYRTEADTGKVAKFFKPDGTEAQASCPRNPDNAMVAYNKSSAAGGRVVLAGRNVVWKPTDFRDALGINTDTIDLEFAKRVCEWQSKWRAVNPGDIVVKNGKTILFPVDGKLGPWTYDRLKRNQNELQAASVEPEAEPQVLTPIKCDATSQLPDTPPKVNLSEYYNLIGQPSHTTSATEKRDSISGLEPEEVRILIEKVISGTQTTGGTDSITFTNDPTIFTDDEINRILADQEGGFSIVLNVNKTDQDIIPLAEKMAIVDFQRKEIARILIHLIKDDFKDDFGDLTSNSSQTLGILDEINKFILNNDIVFVSNGGKWTPEQEQPKLSSENSFRDLYEKITGTSKFISYLKFSDPDLSFFDSSTNTELITRLNLDILDFFESKSDKQTIFTQEKLDEILRFVQIYKTNPNISDYKGISSFIDNVVKNYIEKRGIAIISTNGLEPTNDPYLFDYYFPTFNKVNDIENFYGITSYILNSPDNLISISGVGGGGGTSQTDTVNRTNTGGQANAVNNTSAVSTEEPTAVNGTRNTSTPTTSTTSGQSQGASSGGSNPSNPNASTNPSQTPPVKIPSPTDDEIKKRGFENRQEWQTFQIGGSIGGTKISDFKPDGVLPEDFDKNIKDTYTKKEIINIISNKGPDNPLFPGKTIENITVDPVTNKVTITAKEKRNDGEPFIRVVDYVPPPGATVSSVNPDGTSPTGAGASRGGTGGGGGRSARGNGGGTTPTPAGGTGSDGAGGAGADQPTPPGATPQADPETVANAEQAVASATEDMACKLMKLAVQIAGAVDDNTGVITPGSFSLVGGFEDIDSEHYSIVSLGGGKSEPSPAIGLKSDMLLLYLKNGVYSMFQPFVEINKVKIDSSQTKTIIPIEIPFSSGLSSYGDKDLDFFFSGRGNDPGVSDARSRSQVGIKNFSWNYIGTDRFTATRDIEAELTIEAESLNAIFVDRVNSSGQTYKISDLLFLSDCKKQTRRYTPDQPDASTGAPASSDATVYDNDCYQVIITAGHKVSPDALKQFARQVSGGEDLSTLVSDVLQESNNGFSTENLTFSAENLKRLETSLNLVVVDHTFDFKDDGTVTLKINFRAYTEAVMRDPQMSLNYALSYEDRYQNVGFGNRAGEFSSSLQKVYDILNGSENENLKSIANKHIIPSYGGVGAGGDAVASRPAQINTAAGGNFQGLVQELEQIKYELRSQAEEQTSVSTDNQTVIQKIDEALTVFEQNNANIIWKTVYQKMLTDGNVYFIPLDGSTTGTALQDYYSTPTVDNLVKAVNAMTEAFRTSNPVQNAQGSGALGGSPTAEGVESTEAGYVFNGGIYFVTVGQFLAALFDALDPQLTEKFILATGVVEVPDYSTATGELKTVRISDLPIEAGTLRKFFAEKAANANGDYNMGFFLKDFFNLILGKMLGGNCVSGFKRVSYRPISVIATHYGAQITSNSPTVSLLLEAINPNANSPRDGEPGERQNYYVITYENTDYSGRSAQVANPEDAVKNKIPTYIYGGVDSAFKSCKLSKTDQPFLKEARYKKLGNNLMSQLSNVYDATLSMVGNDLIGLGSLIFIDMSSLGTVLGDPTSTNSVSYYMGLGGFHIVTKVSNNIDISGYNTDITARWVSRLKK